MTNPSDNAASVFDAFGQAYEALKRVPELEHTIAKQTDNIKTLEELMELYKVDIQKVCDERDMEASQRRASEEALEKARKSNSELATRLDLVVSTLSSLSGNIGATLSLVNPEPEPTPEAVGSVSTDPAATAAATAASSSATVESETAVWHVPGNWHHGDDGVSVPSDPTTPTPNFSAIAAGPDSAAPTQPVTTSATEATGSEEVASQTPVPFAQSTESPSATAASTTTAAPPAQSSATASSEPTPDLPNWLYRSNSY